VLESEVAAHLESASSVIVGSFDTAGNPFAGHAYGVRVGPGADRVRVALNADEPKLLEDLRTSGVAAVAVTDVPTLRSIQVKGHVVSVEPATVEDRLATDRWRTDFFAVVNEVDGTPIELLERLRPRAYVCMVMTVDELFDQTPGPQAGASLGAGRP
jgi:hypothetical protein